MVKLNYGGKIVAGGIIRDHNGDLIYAYATPSGQGTNNQAEVEAAIWGLSWCLGNNIHQVILEVYYELLVRWISKQIPVPW